MSRPITRSTKTGSTLITAGHLIGCAKRTRERRLELRRAVCRAGSTSKVLCSAHMLQMHRSREAQAAKCCDRMPFTWCSARGPFLPAVLQLFANWNWGLFLHSFGENIGLPAEILLDTTPSRFGKQIPAARPKLALHGAKIKVVFEQALGNQLQRQAILR